MYFLQFHERSDIRSFSMAVYGPVSFSDIGSPACIFLLFTGLIMAKRLHTGLAQGPGSQDSATF